MSEPRVGERRHTWGERIGWAVVFLLAIVALFFVRA